MIVQTHLWATMSKERLAGLTLMAVHYSEALELNTEEIVQHFVQDNPRRMFCKSILFDDD